MPVKIDPVRSDGNGGDGDLEKWMPGYITILIGLTEPVGAQGNF